MCALFVLKSSSTNMCLIGKKGKIGPEFKKWYKMEYVMSVVKYAIDLCSNDTAEELVFASEAIALLK